MHWVVDCVLILILMRAGHKITVPWFSLKGMGISILSYPGKGKTSKGTNFELVGGWWGWVNEPFLTVNHVWIISGGSGGGRELWKIISML